jgi:hypothetical protein
VNLTSILYPFAGTVAEDEVIWPEPPPDVAFTSDPTDIVVTTEGPDDIPLVTEGGDVLVAEGKGRGGTIPDEFLTTEAGEVITTEGGEAFGTEEVRITFRRALRDQLRTIDGLVELIGSSIYPNAIPQSHDLTKGPALTYSVEKMPGSRGHVLAHTLSGSDGTVEARVTLSAWGLRYSDVDAISVVLFDALDGLINVTWSGVPIVTSFRGPEEDVSEPPTDGEPRVFHIACDYFIRYRIAIPSHQRS